MADVGVQQQLADLRKTVRSRDIGPVEAIDALVQIVAALEARIAATEAVVRSLREQHV